VVNHWTKAVQALHSSIHLAYKSVVTVLLRGHGTLCLMNLNMNKKEYYCYECGTLIPEGSDPYVDKDGSIICEDCYADGGYNDCVRLSEHKQHQYDEDEIAGKCTCHSCGRTFKMTSNTFIDNKGHHYCESCFDDLCRADYDPYHYHEPSMVETPKQTMLIDLSA